MAQANTYYLTLTTGASVKNAILIKPILRLLRKKAK